MHLEGTNARRRQPDRPEATAEEWTQERLGAWVGRALTQVRVSAASLVLDFWELDDDCSAWLYADAIEVSGSGADRVELRVRRTSSEAIVALHSLLGGEVTAAEVTDGRLRLAFAAGAEVLVGPESHQQAWALTFEQGGSITCESGGALDVRVS